MKKKGEIMSKLSATLNNVINNLPLKDRAVALNDNDLVLEFPVTFVICNLLCLIIMRIYCYFLEAVKVS